MKIAVDAQHIGKPGRCLDRGASAGGYREVDVATAYALGLDRRLIELGHDVLWVGAGEYRARWALADSWGAQIYLACHCNAGGQGRDEALIFYDLRSNRGRTLAVSVATGLLGRALAARPDTNGTARDADYSEAFATISGVRAVALCLEPLFLDGARTQARLQADGHPWGLGQEIGRSIADHLHRAIGTWT